MQKVLRSLICEVFPFDLRVELDLLSRRRDIINKEKQTELFKLFKKYDIDAIPLGPGTNRYVFKLNSFAVKFATDSDGRIDNLKEFKMAKRLFPHVMKVYEVSSNGTILVAEYVQPFENYGEMLAHEKEICKILSDMSAAYMIGDVGITKKNYANWGTRLGTTDPVCLDFAYVYDVSSDIMVCHTCHTNTMLSPTVDFVSLKCNNCGKIYEFHEIRRRIGDDAHMHEIGDLSEEGYILTESHTLTNLDESRSGYLKKKQPKKRKIDIFKEDDNVEEDNFFIQ